MISAEWLSKGLVTPRRFQGTGNGLLYTAIYLAVADVFKRRDGSDDALMILGARSCEMKPGLLTRSPGNDQKQESWDDNLGVIVGCAIAGNVEITRRILWYGLRHLGFFNTDGELKGEDWLWRYAHVWALAVPTAYPIVKWLYYPYTYLIGKTLKADHAGGVMLDWLWCYGFFKLYGKHHPNEPGASAVYLALQNQMDYEHPCNAMMR